MVARLVQILGKNAEILAPLLENYMKESPGIFEILTTDTNEYLFQSKTREGEPQAFCGVLRGFPGGESLCKNCRQKRIAQVLEGNVPMSSTYLCDAGLLEIAIPIVVQKQTIAMVFWGQLRSSDPEEEREGVKLTEKTEANLKQSRGMLLTLREQLPTVGPKEIDAGKSKLDIITKHMSNLGREAAEVAEEARKIRFAFKGLESAETIDEFWRGVQRAMEDLCDIISAVAGVLIMHERGQGAIEFRPVAKVVARLPSYFEGRTYIENSKEIKRALQSMEPELIPFNLMSRPGTLSQAGLVGGASPG